MQDGHQNGLATADDFRKASANSVENKPEKVMLPKLGKEVLLKRPSPMWFLFRGRLPQSLAMKVAGDEGLGLDPAEPRKVFELADWVITVLNETMIQPRIALKPGPDEISPDMIDSEDLKFILDWAYGRIGGNGEGNQSSLDHFRRERELPATLQAGAHLLDTAK